MVFGRLIVDDCSSIKGMIIDINLFSTLFGLVEGKIIDINLFNTLFGLVDCLI